MSVSGILDAVSAVSAALSVLVAIYVFRAEAARRRKKEETDRLLETIEARMLEAEQKVREKTMELVRGYARQFVEEAVAEAKRDADVDVATVYGLLSSHFPRVVEGAFDKLGGHALALARIVVLLDRRLKDVEEGLRRLKDGLPTQDDLDALLVRVGKLEKNVGSVSVTAANLTAEVQELRDVKEGLRDLKRWANSTFLSREAWHDGQRRVYDSLERLVASYAKLEYALGELRGAIIEIREGTGA